MEFCTQRELQNQTGHAVYEWPLVVIKELIDNALDACEEAEVAPVVAVTVEEDRIIVQDNAGGIEVGCSHQSLAAFFGVDQVNRAGITRLLEAMQRHSKPVAPKHLGIIGGGHFKERFIAAGGAVATFKDDCRKVPPTTASPMSSKPVSGCTRPGLTVAAA